MAGSKISIGVDSAPRPQGVHENYIQPTCVNFNLPQLFGLPVSHLAALAWLSWFVSRDLGLETARRVTIWPLEA